MRFKLSDNRNGHYSDYDLFSGSHNNWRMSYRWPVIGKGELRVWVAIPMSWIFAFFFADLTTSLMWDIFWGICFLAFLSKMKKMDIFQLKRFFLQRFRVKSKTNTPYWKERSNFYQYATACVLASCLMMNPTDSMAKFEIVIPPKQQPVDSFVSSGQIYLQGGFGKDVKLVDLMNLILPSPLSPEFMSAELKDLKVSWYSDGKIYLNEVLAGISRRYGVQFMWRNSAGILEIKWDNGVCKKIMEESREQQRNYSKQIGYETQTPLRVIQKVINYEQQLEIVC